MGLSPVVILIAAAAGLAGVVLLAALGINMLRQGRQRRSRPARPPAPPADPAGMAAADIASGTTAASSTAMSRPAGGTPLSAAPTASPAMEEVLRVLRDGESGSLVVEMGGQRYASASDLKGTRASADLQAILRDLQALAGAPAEGAARAPGASTAAGLWTPPAPSMNPFRQMQVLREMAKNPPAAPKSITEQIDDILQQKLAGTPLEQRGIHVRTTAQGAALFDLDGSAYPSVDDVPDDDARAVIRAAIAEWESSQ